MAYTLGAEHTAAIIRNETVDEESDILPRGATIALSVLSQDPIRDRRKRSAESKPGAIADTPCHLMVMTW